MGNFPAAIDNPTKNRYNPFTKCVEKECAEPLLSREPGQGESPAKPAFALSLLSRGGEAACFVKHAFLGAVVSHRKQAACGFAAARGQWVRRPAEKVSGQSRNA